MTWIAAALGYVFLRDAKIAADRKNLRFRGAFFDAGAQKNKNSGNFLASCDITGSVKRALNGRRGSGGQGDISVGHDQR